MPRALRGGETIVCDKGYAGQEFATRVAALGGTVARPAQRNEPQAGPHLAPIRQRIESVFFTCKDLLERHSARTPRNLFARIAMRLLALVSASTTNSAAPAARSPTTPPDPWHQSSSGCHPRRRRKTT